MNPSHPKTHTHETSKKSSMPYMKYNINIIHNTWKIHFYIFFSSTSWGYIGEKKKNGIIDLQIYQIQFFFHFYFVELESVMTYVDWIKSILEQENNQKDI